MKVKLIIFSPSSHASLVREALGEAGAGKNCNYDFYSYSTLGLSRSRLRLDNGSGIFDQISCIEEERIETFCDSLEVNRILEEVKKVHPYDEINYYVCMLLNNLPSNKNNSDL